MFYTSLYPSKENIKNHKFKPCPSVSKKYFFKLRKSFIINLKIKTLSKLPLQTHPIVAPKPSSP